MYLAILTWSRALRAIVCKNRTGRDSDGHEIFFPPDILEIYISEKRV